jgi:hypothetical protein
MLSTPLAAGGIVTVVALVGTPPHQLLAVVQLVLVLPNHEPADPHVILLVAGTVPEHGVDAVTVKVATNDPIGKEAFGVNV